MPNDDRNTMLAKPDKLTRLCGASGTLSYLNLSCNSDCSGSNPSGTYTWVSSRSTGSTFFPYPNAEGVRSPMSLVERSLPTLMLLLISPCLFSDECAPLMYTCFLCTVPRPFTQIDIKGNDMYFVTKGQKRLYIVDLASNTWTSGPTIQSDSGETFSPDQVARITGSNSPRDILYFCEDGSGNKDIHALGLDPFKGDKKFFTILQGYSTMETTGLTFSPDNKYMYFAHQANSEIWQIWREDGCSFGDGNYLDINYHTFDEGLRLLRGEPTLQDGSSIGTAEISP